MIDVRVYGVLELSSSSAPRCQISNVLLSISVDDSVDKSLVSVTASVDDSEASLTDDSVETDSELEDSTVEAVSSVTVGLVGSVD